MVSEKVSPVKPKKPVKSLFENPHKNHKINQVITLANDFLQETFLQILSQELLGFQYQSLS
jgi:hypothetical protein